jgi:hypothetical protein
MFPLSDDEPVEPNSDSGSAHGSNKVELSPEEELSMSYFLSILIKYTVSGTQKELVFAYL